eukprot:scaffold2935_cov104-Isochrysis_galbana.AAC.3
MARLRADMARLQVCAAGVKGVLFAALRRVAYMLPPPADRLLRDAPDLPPRPPVHAPTKQN